MESATLFFGLHAMLRETTNIEEKYKLKTSKASKQW
jgi:hypothetical protein